MPFKSTAQQTYLELHKPAVAKQFAAETPPGLSLPTHVKDAVRAGIVKKLMWKRSDGEVKGK